MSSCTKHGTVYSCAKCEEERNEVLAAQVTTLSADLGMARTSLKATQQLLAHIHLHMTNDENFSVDELEADMRNLGCGEWVDTETILIDMRNGFERERLRADAAEAQVTTLTAKLAEAGLQTERDANRIFSDGNRLHELMAERDTARAATDAMKRVVEAAREMPRMTKTGGTNCSAENHLIEHGVVWGLDKALRGFDDLSAPSKEDKTP